MWLVKGQAGDIGEDATTNINLHCGAGSEIFTSWLSNFGIGSSNMINEVVVMKSVIVRAK